MDLQLTDRLIHELQVCKAVSIEYTPSSGKTFSNLQMTKQITFAISVFVIIEEKASLQSFEIHYPSCNSFY